MGAKIGVLLNCGQQSQFSKVRREFDAGRVNLDPPMTCADWPVPGILTILHTQTAYTRKPLHRCHKLSLYVNLEVRSVVSSLFLSRYLLTNPLKTTAILKTFLTNNSINTISNSQTRKLSTISPNINFDALFESLPRASRKPAMPPFLFVHPVPASLPALFLSATPIFSFFQCL